MFLTCIKLAQFHGNQELLLAIFKVTDLSQIMQGLLFCGLAPFEDFIAFLPNLLINLHRVINQRKFTNKLSIKLLFCLSYGFNRSLYFC